MEEGGASARPEAGAPEELQAPSRADRLGLGRQAKGQARKRLQAQR